MVCTAKLFIFICVLTLEAAPNKYTVTVTTHTIMISVLGPQLRLVTKLHIT